MAETKSPFLLRTVPCPACGVRSSQTDFKTGMFAEEEREADQHVTRYRWLRPDVPPVHPPYYALAHCPECAFTDFTEDFLEPTRSRENRVRSLAPRLKTEVARRGSAVEALHKGCRPGPLDFPGALRLHLLAIAIQELLPEERRDHLKIARLYLRTAWLHREQGSTARASLVAQEEVVALDAFATHLRDLRAAAERLATIYAERPESAKLAPLTRSLESLGRSYADFRSALFGQGESRDPLGFLTVLRGDWPAVPGAEAACLEAAVRAFEQVYHKGEGDTLGLLKLLIELNYRLGQFNRVLDYAASMAKSGYDERLRLQQQAMDSSLAPDERSRLTVRINKITATLQLASEIRQETLARQTKAEAGS
jgi:hypothetical protein